MCQCPKLLESNNHSTTGATFMSLVCSFSTKFWSTQYFSKIFSLGKVITFQKPAVLSPFEVGEVFASWVLDAFYPALLCGSFSYGNLHFMQASNLIHGNTLTILIHYAINKATHLWGSWNIEESISLITGHLYLSVTKRSGSRFPMKITT